MQIVLERGFIDKPLTFNIGLLQLIFHTSVFTYNTRASLEWNAVFNITWRSRIIHSTEPGPGPGSIIIRWKNLYYILRIFFMSLSTNYVLMHIYIEDMRTKKAL